MTVSGSTSSVVHGLPLTEDADLGWLACWASNDVGNQRDPCLFRIMPAGKIIVGLSKSELLIIYKTRLSSSSSVRGFDSTVFICVGRLILLKQSSCCVFF